MGFITVRAAGTYRRLQVAGSTLIAIMILLLVTARLPSAARSIATKAVDRAQPSVAPPTSLDYHRYLPSSTQSRRIGTLATPTAVPGCSSRDQEPNDRESEAIAQPQLCRGALLTGFLTDGDLRDTYWLEAVDSSRVSLQMRPAAGVNLSLALYDGFGHLLDESMAPGDAAAEIAAEVPTGRYFVVISPAASGEPPAVARWYTLHAWLSAAQPACLLEEAEPNDRYGEANAGPPMCPDKWLPGTLPDQDDPGDLFWLQFQQAGFLVADLDLEAGGLPPGTDYDLYVYKSGHEQRSIDRSAHYGNQSEHLVTAVEPGRYYLRVLPDRRSSLSRRPYLLRWSWRSEPLRKESP